MHGNHFDTWTRALTTGLSPRRTVLRVLAAGALGAVGTRPGRPARAFKLGPHESITREALAADLSTNAVSKVVGSFVAGTGNLGTDQHQGRPALHFDSADSPQAICQLWHDGVDRYLTLAVARSRPRGERQRELRDRVGALQAFGRALHALQDFYSHSNWIELALAASQTPSTAPLVDTTCDPNGLPADLQSGFFSLQFGLDGCPSAGPPSPFQFCHEQINKDGPTTPHGQEETAPGGATFHELARAVAVAATRQAWQALGDRLRAAYPDTCTDLDCLIDKLAFGGTLACTTCSEEQTCEDGICQDPSRCDNGAKDGNETDVDCGGGRCPRCGFLKQCVEDDDCEIGRDGRGHCGSVNLGGVSQRRCVECFRDEHCAGLRCDNHSCLPEE